MSYSWRFLILWTFFALFVLILIMGASNADTTVCSGGCSYKNIQASINAAKDGDSISVYGPTYKEDIIVNKTLDIHGLIANGRRTILTTDNGTAAILLADGVTLRGFSFIVPDNTTLDGNLAGNKTKDCSTLIVNSEGDSIYLNDFVDGSGICSKGYSSWNSSQKINYQYNSKAFLGLMGNYWADYNGSDKDGDGIGDQPKVIDANNVDYHPLMQPSESYVIQGEKQEVENVINAKLNQPFNISLDSNPTTGYSWTVDFDFRLLNKENESYQRSQLGLIGSGGVQIFTFKPIKTGKTTISAVYKRPWENIVADERAFTIIISE